MTHLILYGNRESGHTYKVKLALTLLGTKHEYREVDIERPREERAADFRKVSTFGEVPVLVDGDLHLVQSNAILLHLARRSRQLGGEIDSNLLTQWLFWEANRIGISVPNLRYAIRWAPQTPEPVMAWLRARALHDLSRLEQEFASRPFLLGANLTVVDIACCAYLFWSDQAGLDLSEWPSVVGWLERIRRLPGWAAPYELLK